jgi:hypothetical protein
MLSRLTFVWMAMSASLVHSQELLLFGGSRHEEFLGCFNCSEFSSDSICNEFGMGNSFRSESIFNEFGTFGNEFSSSSPWNDYSSSDDIPVLVDRNGNFYGYFTINEYRGDAVEFATSLSEIYQMAGGDLDQVQTILCNGINN